MTNTPADPVEASPGAGAIADEFGQQYTRLTTPDVAGCSGFPGIWRERQPQPIDGPLQPTHSLTSMPLTPRYILVCDQVRQENNGKFMVIGLYTPDIVVGAVPAALPTLAFLVAFDSTDVGNITFSFQLSHAGQVLAAGSGGAMVARHGTVILPFNLGPVQLMSAGAYTFSVQIAGRAEPLTQDFRVQLSLPPHAVPTPPPQQVPAGLWADVKAKAKREGISIRALILQLLKAWVEK